MKDADCIEHHNIVAKVALQTDAKLWVVFLLLLFAGIPCPHMHAPCAGKILGSLLSIPGLTQ